MTGLKEFVERFEEWSRSVQRTANETSVAPRQEDSDNVESHVHKPVQVPEFRRAPSPLHAQLIDRGRRKPSFFVVKFS